MLAFGFLREITADEFYLTPLLGLDYFALLLLLIVNVCFIAKTQVSPSVWSFLAHSSSWFLADMGLLCPAVSTTPLLTYVLIDLACTLAPVPQI